MLDAVSIYPCALESMRLGIRMYMYMCMYRWIIISCKYLAIGWVVTIMVDR